MTPLATSWNSRPNRPNSVPNRDFEGWFWNGPTISDARSFHEACGNGSGCKEDAAVAGVLWYVWHVDSVLFKCQLRNSSWATNRMNTDTPRFAKCSVVNYVPGLSVNVRAKQEEHAPLHAVSSHPGRILHLPSYNIKTNLGFDAVRHRNLYWCTVVPE